MTNKWNYQPPTAEEKEQRDKLAAELRLDLIEAASKRKDPAVLRTLESYRASVPNEAPAATKDLVQGGSGHDPHLAQPGHGFGQAPVGNTGPHASLYDGRKLKVHPVQSTPVSRNSEDAFQTRNSAGGFTARNSKSGGPHAGTRGSGWKRRAIQVAGPAATADHAVVFNEPFLLVRETMDVRRGRTPADGRDGYCRQRRTGGGEFGIRRMADDGMVVFLARADIEREVPTAVFLDAARHDHVHAGRLR